MRAYDDDCFYIVDEQGMFGVTDIHESEKLWNYDEDGSQGWVVEGRNCSDSCSCVLISKEHW